MLHGKMSSIVAEKGVEALRAIANDFFTKYLRFFNPDTDLSLLESLEGIAFMPVDKNVYLRIISFNNLIGNTFGQIRETVFLYRDQLLWSGLEQDDIQVLYHFINRFVICEVEQPTQDFIPFVRNANGFMTGPLNLEENRPFSLPIIHVGGTPMFLIIYRVGCQ